MARTAGAAGMLDIRSAAILEDFIYASDPCLPGATTVWNMKYGRSNDIVIFTKEFR